MTAGCLVVHNIGGKTWEGRERNEIILVGCSHCLNHRITAASDNANTFQNSNVFTYTPTAPKRDGIIDSFFVNVVTICSVFQSIIQAVGTTYSQTGVEP